MTIDFLKDVDSWEKHTSNRTLTTTMPAEQPNSDVNQVQQFLLNWHLPIKDAKKTPINDQAPDGGWGPVSNSSLSDFIDTHLLPGSDKNAASIAAALDGLWSKNPKQTLARMPEILKALEQKGQVEVSAVTPTGAKPVPEDQGQILFDVTVSGNAGNAGNYENVPIYDRVLASAGNLEQTMAAHNMLDLTATNQVKLNQVKEAALGMAKAIRDSSPTNPHRWENTIAYLFQQSQVLMRSYLESKDKKDFKDFVMADGVRKLRISRLPQADQETLMNAIKDLLLRESAITPDGLLSSANSAVSYNAQINQLVDRAENLVSYDKNLQR